MKCLRIMVVEDEFIIAFLLGETLKDMGHDVCASEGTEAAAISAALACKPDLMIVDAHLGRGSGIAVVEAVRLCGPVPTVFVSGDAQSITSSLPGAIVIQKPYFEADLAQAIESAMAPDRWPQVGDITPALAIGNPTRSAMAALHQAVLSG